MSEIDSASNSIAREDASTPHYNGSVIKRGNGGQAGGEGGRHDCALDVWVSLLTALPMTASSRRPPPRPLRLLTCALLISASLHCSTQRDEQEGMAVEDAGGVLTGGRRDFYLFLFFVGKSTIT